MMRTLLLALAFCGLASTASAQPVADPLAPAREGQLQCYSPNAAAKTCRALSSYAFAADGGIVSSGVVLIQPAPLILFAISTPVFVRDGAVCGPVTVADLDRGVFSIDGAAATPEQHAAIRNAIAPVIEAMSGENCSLFTTEGGVITTTATLNGAAIPNYSETVSWVRADEGYTVRGP